MGAKGKIIKLMPRKTYTFQGKTRKYTGDVKIKLDNGETIIVPVATLKAEDGFSQLSSKQMTKSMERPYHGRRVGQRVELSDEQYWD